MKPQPLLRRAAFYPGESPTSLLTRLAQANYCGSVSTLYKLFLTETQTEDALEMRKAQIGWGPEVFERLARLTGLPPAELHAASVHHFASVLTPPDAPPEKATLFSGEKVSLTPERFGSKKLRNDDAAEYCPACLAERAYHRLAWIPVMTAACLQHRCLLWEGCPKCHAPVSVETVLKAQCRQCYFPLSQAPVIDLRQDALGLFAQTLLQAWLYVAPAPERPWPWALPDQPPLALYHFLDGLCSAIAHCDAAWLNKYAHTDAGRPTAWDKARTRKNLPPDVAYSVYTTAFHALAPWPEGFYEFLRAYALRDGRSSGLTGRLEDDLGYFYGKTLEKRWQHPAFEFVQQAFNAFLISDYSTAPGILKSNRYRTDEDFAAHFGGVSLRRAAQILGVGTPTIAHLIVVGRLSTGTKSIREHRPLVPKTDVRALRERWDETLSLDEAAHWLGLTPDRVIDLAKAEALVVERGPIADESRHWRFARQSVCTFLERVKQHIGSAQMACGSYLSLRNASKLVAPVHGNAATLLIAVAEGKLRASEPQVKEKRLLNNLRFCKSDVRNLVVAIGAARGWLSLDDVAEHMGVTCTVVRKWMRNSLLQPVARYAYAYHFNREAVEQFAAAHVFSEQAAQILGVGMVVVQKWARDGRLRPVASEDLNGCHRYLFRREDVERLRPENRLTAPQLAKKLGLSRSQISVWIRRGKIQPISGPGIDGAKHYLFAADQLPGGIP